MRNCSQSNAVLCVSLFLLQVCITRPDFASNWARTKIDIFNGTFKIWYSHVTGFLKHYLETLYPKLEQIGINSFLRTLFHQFEHSQNRNFANKLLQKLKSLLNSQLYYLHITDQFLTNIRPLVISVVLSRASGQMLLNSSLHPSTHPVYLAHCRDGFIQRDDCSYYDQAQKLSYLYSAYLLQFKLSRKLSLNVTFEEIMFGSGANNFVGGNVACDTGHLFISSHPQNNSRLSEDFTLCGHLSSFSVHPRFQAVYLLAKIYPSTRYHIFGEFQIQDKNLRLVISLTKHNERKVVGFLIIQSIWTLVTFKIEVSKTKQLLLFMNRDICSSDKVLVLDGPGYQSPRVKQKANVYHLTSFHSLAIRLQKYDEQRFCLNFSSKNTPLLSVDINSVVNFSLPNVQLCSQMCALSLQTKENLQLNLTVWETIYEGTDSEMCKYGGFTTAQQLNGKYQENEILCETFQVSAGRSRSYYSSNSTLLTFLFQFHPYSKVSVNFVVDTTVCQCVSLCPCTLQKVCPPPNYFNLSTVKIQFATVYHNKTEKCDAFWNSIRKRHNLTIMYLNPNFHDFISIWPKKSACLVVQVSRIQSCSVANMAKTTHTGFSLTLLLENKQNIEYVIKGVLDQNLHNREKWRNCMFKCGLQNKLFVFENIVQSTAQARFIHLEGKHQHMFVQVNEPLHAKNWIEIQLRSFGSNTTRAINFFVPYRNGQQVRMYFWSLLLSKFPEKI